MKFKLLILLLIPVFLAALTIPAKAATTPNLGQAASFGILSGTYTNTASGTTINGDLGYTTAPAVAPTVNGTTHAADGTYNQAGIDQSSALSDLASQPCTHTFPSGAVDLSTDTSHGPIGVYAPGVYCTTASSAASVGTGGMTLSGAGTYIFRIDGALTTVANSAVILAGGASECDVFWTPSAATTLGANSTFRGTIIDAAGITIGSTVTWVGRALAFGGTVSTDTDTITSPNCAVVPSPTSGTSPSPSSAPSASPSSSPSTSPSPSGSPGATPTPSSSPTPAPSVSTNSSTSSSSSTSTGGESVTAQGPAAAATTSPGFPNAGNPLIPRLPDAGIGPD